MRHLCDVLDSPSPTFCLPNLLLLLLLLLLPKRSENRKADKKQLKLKKCRLCLPKKSWKKKRHLSQDIEEWATDKIGCWKTENENIAVQELQFGFAYLSIDWIKSKLKD